MPLTTREFSSRVYRSLAPIKRPPFPQFLSSRTTGPWLEHTMSSTCQSEVDVLIIGAGPAGLMCANALVHAGVNIKIVDKRYALSV